MTSEATKNIERINKLWEIHETSDGCLYFFLDDRYCFYGGPNSFEMRVGVSYGSNPFTEEMTKDVFVSPPYKPGQFLFGIHCVGVSNGKLTLYDQWIDSRDVSPDRLLLDEARRQATEILEAISDVEYTRIVSDGPSNNPKLYRSDNTSLDNMEVVHSEAF